MNLLVNELPETLNVDGKEYKIDSGFRSCLLCIMAFEDNALTPQEKNIILLRNTYEKIPANTAEALKQAVWFLNGGEYLKEDEAPAAPVRVYSFNKDSNFIFSAFRQTHGVDLSQEDLHWWKFLALFMDLGSETTFSSLVSLRKRIKTGKASKEEKATARELGDLIELEEIDDQTLEEKEKEKEFLAKVKAFEEKRKQTK